MKTINVSDAGKDLYYIVEQASKNNEAVLITGDQYNAVLIPEGTYKAAQELLGAMFGYVHDKIEERKWL